MLVTGAIGDDVTQLQVSKFYGTSVGENRSNDFQIMRSDRWVTPHGSIEQMIMTLLSITFHFYRQIALPYASKWSTTCTHRYGTSYITVSNVLSWQH